MKPHIIFVWLYRMKMNSCAFEEMGSLTTFLYNIVSYSGQFHAVVNQPKYESKVGSTIHFYTCSLY